MKKTILYFGTCFYFFFGIIHPVISQNQPLRLIPVSTHHTGLFNLEGAESVAFDPVAKRLFFSNVQSSQIGILDIRKPELPVLLDSFSLASLGDRITHITCSNGKIAASVVAFPSTAPGKVGLFDTAGKLLAQYTVGVAPKMVAFTPDGKKLLVANEGLPADDYSIDPEGSVSLIDLEKGQVQTLGFTAFNSQAAELQKKGVRLFASGSTLSQELEPEWIALNAEGTMAWITLPENNAMATLHISDARITDIYPLGLKDFRKGGASVTESFLLPSDLPQLGTPVYKDSLPAIHLGGFSGLYFDQPASSDSVYVFYTLTDRGPIAPQVPISRAFGAGNEQTFVELRPFLLPDFQNRLVRLSYHTRTARVVLDTQIYFTRLQNNIAVPITGRTNVIGFDEIPVTYSRKDSPYEVQDWIDTLTKVTYTELPYDPFGADMEGVVRDRDGNFWVCDEIRPSLYKFQPDGRMVSRFVPKGTSALGIIDLGQGSYGDEILPTVYRKRWTERGFSAIAYDPSSHIVYAFLQSPLFNPNSSTENKSDVIRILGVNAANGLPVSEYVYLLENNRNFSGGQGRSRVDKISDAVFTGNGTFLVTEIDSAAANQPGASKILYEIDIRNATNLLSNTTLSALSAKEKSSNANDKTLEMMTSDDLSLLNIHPVAKRTVLNLPSAGYRHGDLPEGLSLLPNGNLAVLNDNQYGKTAGASNDTISLGILTFGDNSGLDASDRDAKIAINPHPVLGMYQSTGIATFQSAGNTYLLTANEGAARTYSALNEAVRIGSPTYALDGQVFTNSTALKQESSLGRLYASNATGDLDNDGDFDQIHIFGTRSFSIRDGFGQLVFDSGSDFERIVRDNPSLSPYFNISASDNSPSGKDSRSDDQGSEPNTVVFAAVDGVPYALIGLKSMGGIMAYSIQNPNQPQFAGYFSNRNFAATAQSSLAGDLGISQLLFIPATDSPNGAALVVTANAVSGTVTIFSTREISTDVNDLSASSSWQCFPNPVSHTLYTTEVGDYEVYNTFGQQLRRVQNTNQIDTQNLPAGTYLLRSPQYGDSRLFTVVPK